MMNEQRYRDFLILYPILSNVLLHKKVEVDYLQAFIKVAQGCVGKGDSKVIDSKVNILDVMQHALILECRSLEKVEGINDTIGFLKELGTVDETTLTEFNNFITQTGYKGEYMDMLHNLEELKHRRTGNDGTSK